MAFSCFKQQQNEKKTLGGLIRQTRAVVYDGNGGTGGSIPNGNSE